MRTSSELNGDMGMMHWTRCMEKLKSPSLKAGFEQSFLVDSTFTSLSYNDDWRNTTVLVKEAAACGVINPDV